MIDPPPEAWELVIHGTPVGQPRVKARAVGGVARVYNPTTIGEGTQLGIRPHPILAWKLAATRAAEALAEELAGMWIVGPVQVDAEFVFPRPLTEIRKKHQARRHHTAKPDRDNLDKAILDAMTGHLFRDDSQVAAGWIEKWVTATGEEPHATVCVSLLPGATLEPKPDPQPQPQAPQ